MVALWTAAVSAVVVLLAEWLHARRCKRLALLAFGPDAMPRQWARFVPPFRALAIAALAWGLVTLVTIAPQVAGPRPLTDKDLRHVVLVFDVSPSMQLVDAGPAHVQTRAARAAELVRSIIGRVPTDRVRFSFIAVYNGAKRVVVDTKDLAVIYNILNDLPMAQAFDIGKTLLFDGIKEAAALASDWPRNTATVIVVSDGDTVPDSGMPTLPASIAGVVVIGVGDSRAGKYIDGHQSRQDTVTLRQLALRLNGTFHDGNEKHVSSEALRKFAMIVPINQEASAGIRELAIAATAAGAAVISAIPLALAFMGTRWRAGASLTNHTRMVS